jgi:hypothetical protein
LAAEQGVLAIHTAKLTASSEESREKRGLRIGDRKKALCLEMGCLKISDCSRIDKGQAMWQGC